MKEYMKRVALENEINRLKSQLSCVKSQMNRELNRIDEVLKVEYTGLYVCIDADYKSAWICDVYEDSDEEMNKLDKASVILPIPKAETLKEFDGF